MPDATALAAAISQGRTNASTVMEASLAACDAQAGLGAVVLLEAGMGRSGAGAADACPAGQRGPLHGLPFLGKDLGAAASGLAIGAGSQAMRARAVSAPEDSDLFSGFRRAGLIPFGLTATPPFGLSLDSTPEQAPPARNPWNPDLTPGGSSGGAAAAVAAGLVAMAHATDAAGSIRVPAACCGLVGLKPSRGVTPGGPDYNNHLMGIAGEGVLARSVRDVTTAFVAVHPPQAPFAVPPAPRIALALPERCDAAQTAAARAAADALADAGCVVKTLPAPDAQAAEAQRIARRILAVSLAEWLSALAIPDDSVPPLAAALAMEGRRTQATALYALTRDMARLSHCALAMFDRCDAILSPVLSGPPPPIGTFGLDHTDVDAHFARMEAFAPNAALANVAGLPALALPFGLQGGGLPVGVQLWARPGAELLLCDLARRVEVRAPALTYPHPVAGLPL